MLAVARYEIGTIARIVAAWPRATDIELFDLIQRQICDRGTRRGDPYAALIPAEFGAEPKVMDHDDVAVAGKLHIDLRAICSERNSMRKGADRVFRAECCAAPMRDAKRRRQKTIRNSGTQREKANSTPGLPFRLEWPGAEGNVRRFSELNVVGGIG